MAYLTDTRMPSYSPLGLVSGFAVVKRWAAISKERRALRNMTSAQLEDIGLSYDNAMREAARPFWASHNR
ncbi:MAG: DUF1127 domain-containing protein [Pikeienuella sp.]